MPEPKIGEYRLSPAALSDLDAIWDYSAGMWSVTQAETCIRGLASDMDLLVQHPGIARERTEIYPAVRLYLSGSHLIIYRIEAGWLEVLRIVHARQNWAAYLNE
ncbi:type II toxin-antitoxin system RelE/ParE family toxin [Rhodobacter maris]|nr:type II toxin-antitoxin system RelE/ParE family toxin [Rhodobacter maris]